YNAFALPGGYAYMFDAMMEMLDTDDMIAAVIAHEIGHITAKHAMKRMQGSLGVNALMILAAAMAGSGGTLADTNEAISQMMMSYSRDDEFEADRLSVKYTKMAGFNPNGVIQSLTRLKELRKNGREMRYAFYKTHPYLSERISFARNEIKGYTDFDSYINVPEQRDGFY
ncbi:MAG: M48 family metalloprotease, partial [Candidatus Omnitrophota bacterium]